MYYKVFPNWLSAVQFARRNRIKEPRIIKIWGENGNSWKLILMEGV